MEACTSSEFRTRSEMEDPKTKNVEGNLVVPLDVEFKKLGYQMNVKGRTIEILHSLCGGVKMGEITAVMGPSGAGKTTFLNILTGQYINGMSGKILFNGFPRTKAAKVVTAHVTQRDVFFEDLTVFEILKFAGLLRLGNSMNRIKLRERLEHLLSQMGLEKRRNQPVKNCSGGERKRLSIACELVLNPSLLILDEPTTGLDGTTARDLIESLRDMARTNSRTVVCSLHQPSNQVLMQFDKVIFFMEGHIVYQGRVKDILPYFSSIGYEPPMACTAEQFVMSLLCDVTNLEHLLEHYNARLKKTLDDEFLMSELEDGAQSGKGASDDQSDPTLEGPLEDLSELILSDASNPIKPLASMCLKHPPHSNAVTTSTTASDSHVDPTSSTTRALRSLSREFTVDELVEKRVPKTSYFFYLRVLLHRALLLEMRREKDFRVLLNLIIICVIGGLVYFRRLSVRQESYINDQLGFFSLLDTLSVATVIPAMTNVYVNREVLAKERSSKMWPVSTCYAAILFSSCLTSAVKCTLHVIIIPLMAAIDIGVLSYVMMWLLTVMLSLSTTAAAMFCGIVCPNVKQGFYLFTIIIWLSLVSGGGVNDYNEMVDGMKALNWLASWSFSFGGRAGIFFQDMDVACASSYSMYSMCPDQPIPGNLVLRLRTKNLPIWANFVALAAHFSAFVACSYFVLQFGSKWRL